MVKRDRCTVGIWVGVALLHAAGVWAALPWLIRTPASPPEVRWVQTIAPPPPEPTPAHVRAPLPTRAAQPASVATPAPVAPPVPGRAPRSEARAEGAAPAASEPSPLTEPRPEAHRSEGRMAEAQAPTSAGEAVSSARTGGADLMPPSQSASYLNNPPPPYPPMSKRLGEQGRVVVRVFIDEQGLPKDALLEVKSGYSRLDQAALQAVMSWRYVPAQRAGVPLAMWFNVPVTFDLKLNKE